MSDLIKRDDALKPFCIAPDGTRIPEVDCDNFPVEFSVKFIKKHLLSLPSTEPKAVECSGCKCLGSYDLDFSCVNCVRKTKDYYCEADMRGGDTE